MTKYIYNKIKIIILAVIALAIVGLTTEWIFTDRWVVAATLPAAAERIR